MNEKQLDRRLRASIQFLIGIGLVLTGLAVAILWVLVAGQNERSLPRSVRVAEPVQLGRSPVEADRPPTDSPDRLPDVAALNEVFRQVADRVTPSVVYIQADIPFGRDRHHDFDEEEQGFFRRYPLPEAVEIGRAHV